VPDPELAPGADELFSPEPDVAAPEADELEPDDPVAAFELPLPGEVPVPEAELPDELVPRADWCAAEALAGKVAATPAAASTLARPAAAVTARSRFRLRSLAAARSPVLPDCGCCFMTATLRS